MPDILLNARQLAIRAHQGHKRQWTERDYFEHPERVAVRVAALGGTDNMIAAAFLHDVLEDTSVTECEIHKTTNQEVLEMVRALTNTSLDSKAPRAERKAMDRAKLANAPREVKFIKLLDRIDNLHEMDGAKKEFKILYAKESLLLAEVIGEANLTLKAELIRAARALLD